jgi:tryptophan synthase alpha chain
VLDGATIQEASDRALARGATVAGILGDVAAIRHRLHIPLIAMTYANLVFRAGADEFCERLAAAGFRGLIVPDLPVDEIDALEKAAKLRKSTWSSWSRRSPRTTGWPKSSPGAVAFCTR